MGTLHLWHPMLAAVRPYNILGGPFNACSIYISKPKQDNALVNFNPQKGRFITQKCAMV